MSNFTHLHLHTEYSLLDGACRIKDVIDRAVELGQTSIAVTDHGVMYGAIDFYKYAKSKNIKPIIGCEVYVAPRKLTQKEHVYDSKRYHLVLLCKNNTGYQNLLKIVSESFVKGFYVKPRVDKDLLKKYHEGIIALSACLAGEIPQSLLNGNYDEAKQKVYEYCDIFGKDNFFLEVQNHNYEEEDKIRPYIVKLSEETGVKLCATNDTHYVNKDDHKTQKVLLCIQTNKTIDEDTGLDFQTQEFYLKSEDEMRPLFEDCPEAVDNTQLIADKCNVEIEFGNTKLPNFDVPDGYTHYEWFEKLCKEGFEKRYGKNPPAEYVERLKYELETIDKMGYTDYYLIVHDFVNYAKTHAIPVGPGRGSGAGSIAAYSIGITGIDPMKYNLLFERFLNPERVSMPDFDIDFCYVKRDEVIKYVNRKYGSDHVSQIVTFGTMAARAAVRDVGRALGMPYGNVDKIAKLIPRELNITIDKALTASPELIEEYNSSAQVKELIDTAKKVEGMPRHASKHAAGIVITKNPVDTYVPLALNEDSVVTQYTMTTLEELGLLKMDFLGLRTLTVIDNCIKLINKDSVIINQDSIPLDDKATFEMFSSGQTDGVFQFESAGMRSVLSQLKPESIEDIIAVISLYRPGPMDSIPTYIKNRHNPELVTYKMPLLRDILDVTYGCILYQEQVMQIFRKLAGYSYGRADIVRRAMSKKKHAVMQAEREYFIHGLVNEDGTVECEGAVKRGVDEKTANEIFDQMSTFSQYAFNKSHAAAYAYVSYITAYLKCHYPRNYFAALISSVLDNTSKVSEYIEECKKLGIRILSPDVNSSFEEFTVDGDNILFGLLAIKNIGRNFIKSIITERELNGRFTTFASFCSRIYGKDVNKRAIEALVYSGALDGLDMTRKQMINVMPKIFNDLDNSKKNKIDGQLGLFGEESDVLVVDYKSELQGEFSFDEKLRYEKDYTGIYISGHPMGEIEDEIEPFRFDRIKDILSQTGDESVRSKYADSYRAKTIGIVSSVKRKTTKSNETMAFVEIEDIGGSMEILVFPKIFIDNSSKLTDGAILVFEGRLSVKEDEDVKMVCERVFTLEEYKNNTTDLKKTTSGKKTNLGLYIKFNSSKNEKLIDKCKNVLDVFSDGATDVYFYFQNENKVVRLKSFKVSVNEPMLNELKRIVGAENVKIKS